MKCSKCGADLPDNAIFCAVCGLSIESSAATCPNCSAALKPGALFCPACGTSIQTGARPIQVASPVYQQQYAPPVVSYGNAYQAAPGMAPKKKSKGPIIAIAAVVIVALLGGAYLFFGNSIRKSLLGPKAYYESVEASELKSSSADLVSDLAKYGNKAGNEKGGAEVSFQVSLEEDNLGIDASTAASIENITLLSTLLFDRTGDTPMMYESLDLMASDEKLATIEMLYDEDIYVGAPGLLDKYILITADELSQYTDMTGINAASMSSLNGILKTMGGDGLGIDEAAMQSTINKAVDIMLKHVDECKLKSGVTLEADGVKAKYDRYTSTIENDSAKAMVIEILEMLQKDEKFFDSFSNLYSSAAGADADAITFEDYQDQLQTAIDDIDANESDQEINITHEVYVNSSDEIVGRNLTFTDGDDNMLMNLMYAHPIDGKDEGISYSFEAGINSMEYVSSYTNENGKKTGEAALSVNGAEIGTIKFEDIETQTIGEDEFTVGTATIDLSSAAAQTGMPIVIDFTGSIKNKTYTMEISVQDMAAVTIAYTAIAAGDVNIPDLSGEDTVSISNQEELYGLITPEVQQKLMDIADQLGIPLGN